jgi:hypothetical protein
MPILSQKDHAAVLEVARAVRNVKGNARYDRGTLYIGGSKPGPRRSGANEEDLLLVDMPRVTSDTKVKTVALASSGSGTSVLDASTGIPVIDPGVFARGGLLRTYARFGNGTFTGGTCSNILFACSVSIVIDAVAYTIAESSARFVNSDSVGGANDARWPAISFESMAFVRSLDSGIGLKRSNTVGYISRVVASDQKKQPAGAYIGGEANYGAILPLSGVGKPAEIRVSVAGLISEGTATGYSVDLLGVLMHFSPMRRSVRYQDEL